jgi:phosphoglycolate phosphatase-like HAD superfamily hydrolase
MAAGSGSPSPRHRTRRSRVHYAASRRRRAAGRIDVEHDAELSKPSPEIFRAALDQLGTAVETTMTVGDTPYDVLASHRAALPIAAVLTGGFARETLAKAEWLCDGVEQLVGEIDTIDEYFSA